MSYQECRYPDCGNPVFSTELCRKHYERERLETAAPCSVSGCKGKAYRGVLCVTHYREQLRSTRPLCTVANCTAPQKTLSSKLCEKHLLRFSRHGTVEQPRNADWGAREKHPLYQIWHWQRRRAERAMCDEWHDDFWAFGAIGGEKPGGHTLRRVQTDKVLGPDNWEWNESVPSKDKNEYLRERPAANPDRTKG